MPLRQIPLVTGEIYHAVNRGVGSIPTFRQQTDYQRFTKTLQYYRHAETPLKYSKLLSIATREREKIISNLERSQNLQTEILTYCLMPNHFHLLLRQTKDGGISNFIRLAANSYSKFFNTKYQREGPLFRNRFKAVRVETEEQLLHLARYIHLNPYTAYLVKDFEALLAYPFSSLPDYLDTEKPTLCQKDTLLSMLGDVKSFKDFVHNRADYQRGLKLIEHQILE